MSLTVQTGDLLAIDRGILCHQVNCRGVTGGLAGALARKWPLAFHDYQKACKAHGSLNLGSTLLCSIAPGLDLAHVFGQLDPGANTNLDSADWALGDLQRQLAVSVELSSLQIYVPYLMGCGLGGGRWAEYEPMIEKHFPSAIVIKLPESK